VEVEMIGGAGAGDAQNTAEKVGDPRTSLGLRARTNDLPADDFGRYWTVTGAALGAVCADPIRATPPILSDIGDVEYPGISLNAGRAIGGFGEP